jgi:hypothetical protein
MKSDIEAFYYVCDGKSGISLGDLTASGKWVKTPDGLGQIPLLQVFVHC